MSYDPLTEKPPTQYEPVLDKTPVEPMQMGQPSSTFDYKNNSDIRRSRTILLVVLGIQLVLALIYSIAKMVDMIKFYQLPVKHRGSGGNYIGGFTLSLVSVAYIIGYIIVAAMYLRIGILVFAWLGLIQLIIICIIVFLAILAMVGIGVLVGLGSTAAGAAIGAVGSIVVIVTAGILCLLTILVVAFGFKLAKYLKIHEAYQSV